MLKLVSKVTGTSAMTKAGHVEGGARARHDEKEVRRQSVSRRWKYGVEVHGKRKAQQIQRAASADECNAASNGCGEINVDIKEDSSPNQLSGVRNQAKPEMDWSRPWYLAWPAELKEEPEQVCV